MSGISQMIHGLLTEAVAPEMKSRLSHFLARELMVFSSSMILSLSVKNPPPSSISSFLMVLAGLFVLLGSYPEQTHLFLKLEGRFVRSQHFGNLKIWRFILMLLVCKTDPKVFH